MQALSRTSDKGHSRMVGFYDYAWRKLGANEACPVNGEGASHGVLSVGAATNMVRFKVSQSTSIVAASLAAAALFREMQSSFG